MPLTIAEIKAKAASVKEDHTRSDGICYNIIPPLTVRCRNDLSGERAPIEKGQVLHVTHFYDKFGKFPNHIHFLEKLYWWEPEDFELVEA